LLLALALSLRAIYAYPQDQHPALVALGYDCVAGHFNCAAGTSGFNVSCGAKFAACRYDGNASSGVSMINFQPEGRSAAPSVILPNEIGLLTDTLILSLKGSPTIQLGGVLPAEAIGKLAKLQQLKLLSSTKLAGIMIDFGVLTGLTNLQLTDLGISGTISDNLRLLSNLRQLDFNDIPYLSGTLPDIGELNLLTNLDIYALYQLSGSMPSPLSKLTSLQALGFFSNQFSGFLPDVSGNTAISLLRIQSLKLSGTVPDSFSKLVASSHV
jgi:hypothetical protein